MDGVVGAFDSGIPKLLNVVSRLTEAGLIDARRCTNMIKSYVILQQQALNPTWIQTAGLLSPS
jgi:hypothetical protein